MNSIPQMCESLEKARDEAELRLQKHTCLDFEATKTCIHINYHLVKAKDENLGDVERGQAYQAATEYLQYLVGLADDVDAIMKGESE